ncbi:hypothetical protein AR543_p0075 (plasmid) [Paenibacillus bovis]|uniref:Uncharacterized protein n=1 Tax=Paenibacillus bovis TaxID=1616788 RepID=A0A1X9T425_9BACL|nr:hypothetical protein AR543_p0075 [Paenibacillus bovis]
MYGLKSLLRRIRSLAADLPGLCCPIGLFFAGRPGYLLLFEAPAGAGSNWDIAWRSPGSIEAFLLGLKRKPQEKEGHSDV